MGSDAAEFVNKVKDQVRSRQKRMSNVAESGEQHAIIWECSWLRRWMRRHSWERISQPFKVSSKILKISLWSRCSMSPRSWWMTRTGQNSVGKEFLEASVTNWWCNNHQSSKHKVYVFSDSVLCLGRILQHPDSNEAWWTELQGSNPWKATEIMMLSTESRRNSSGTFSQDSQRCSSVVKSMIYWATWDKHQKLSQEEFYLCRCSMESPVTEKATKMNV